MMTGFVKIEAERKFAGRHGTEAGDDPVFDELYAYAGELREEVDAYEEVLRKHEEENKRAAESDYVKQTFTKEEVVRELQNQIAQIRGGVAILMAHKQEEQVRIDNGGKFVARDCGNWSNNDHCARTGANYCNPYCRHWFMVR